MKERTYILFKKRKDLLLEDIYVTLHSFVRASITNKSKFYESYREISKFLFPLYESAGHRNVTEISKSQLMDLGYKLYHYEKQNALTSSCLSIALTIQSLLFTQGINSNLSIGIKKEDGKLKAHSWVTLLDGDVIDPYNFGLELTPLSKLSMYREIERMYNKNETLDCKDRENRSIMDNLV